MSRYSDLNPPDYSTEVRAFCDRWLVSFEFVETHLESNHSKLSLTERAKVLAETRKHTHSYEKMPEGQEFYTPANFGSWSEVINRCARLLYEKKAS